MIWSCLNPQKLDKHDKQCNYKPFLNFITYTCITKQCTTVFTFTFQTALTWSQDGYKQWYVFSHCPLENPVTAIKTIGSHKIIKT